MKLQDAKVFSLLDARSGYHQILVSKSSQKYLVFSSPLGNFQYTRLHFGVSSGPAIFKKVIQYLVQDLPGILVYFDDILVFGQDQDDHLAKLHAVLKRLHESGLKLNQEKCEFFRDEAEFLGHVLTANSVKPQPNKMNAIRDFPTPSNES